MKRDKFVRDNNEALAKSAAKCGLEGPPEDPPASTPTKATSTLDMELIASLIAGEMVTGTSNNNPGSSRITELQNNKAYNDFAKQEQVRQRQETGTNHVPSV
jgi:hypothetical protein